MTERYDTAVVGGGIVGASVSYHLARKGVETLLIDRNDDGRATDAGAGVISPATSSRTGDDGWFDFATDAVAYYPELNAQLERRGAGETSYRRQGTIAAAIDSDEIEPYEEAVRRIDERGLDSIEEIDPEAAIEQFPALAEPKRAFYYPEAARVDGRAFADALLAAARTHGLETLDSDVVSLHIRNRTASGVETAGEGRVDAENVVVAGGAWSPTFAEALGVNLPVEPHRGQVAHLDLPETETDSWPIVNGFRHHYIVPWPDGKIVFGATREPDAGFDPRLTAGGVDEVLTEGLRVAPGLSDATLEELRVGLRPVSADRRPILGAIPDIEGAYVATGHGATGLMLGPYSGKIVADRVAEETGHIPDRFSVARFEDGDESK
jgi:D-amino-acid dehydrogenase